MALPTAPTILVIKVQHLSAGQWMCLLIIRIYLATCQQHRYPRAAEGRVPVLVTDVACSRYLLSPATSSLIWPVMLELLLATPFPDRGTPRIL